jgi:hypothetical protein
MSEVVMGLDTASNRLHWVCSRPVMGALYGAVHSGHSNPDVRRMNLYDCAYSLFASIRGDPVHVFCRATFTGTGWTSPAGRKTSSVAEHRP